MDRHQPDAVAIERVFSQHNVRTVMGTAQAGGVVALAAARRGIPVAWHTPSEVKAAVSGNGKADKAQVTAMVTRLLRLPRAAPAGRRRRCAGAGDVPPVALADAGPRLADRPRAAAQLARPAARRRWSRAWRGHDQLVRGLVLAVELDRAVIEVGGVGSPSARRPRRWPGCAAGEEARLATTLVVREDSLTLYGFADDDGEGAVRAGAVGVRGRPEDRAGGARRARPRTWCEGDRRRGTPRR